jgi:type IV pilus assembly protein PilP
MMSQKKALEGRLGMGKLMKVFMLMPILSLSACMDDKPDLAQYVAQVKSQQKVDIEPMPVMKPYEKFSYDASNLRDPFIATVTEVAIRENQTTELIDNGIRPDSHRRKEALESYSLGELQFVGTLEQDGVWALVRASDGIINRVQVGNYMGQNHGKVLAISEAKIRLKEIVADGNGMYIERDSALSIVEVN